MKIIDLSSRFALAALILSVQLTACEGKKKAEAPATPTNTNLCGPVHEMAGRTKVWEKSQCAKADTYWVDQSTVSDKGVALGKINANHGLLSVKYHGLLNDHIKVKIDDSPWDNYGVFFKAYGWNVEDPYTLTRYDGEANWWFMAAKFQENQIKTWLGSQRFDGVCGTPPNFCEEKDFHDWDLQFFDPTDVVRFDCGWSYSTNAPDGLVWCDITKTNTGEKHHYEAPMKGPYYYINYVGVGSKAFDHNAYPSFPGPVSEYKVTLFE